MPPRRTEEAASPRPEPSDDFPGTEPVLEDVAKERTGEVPPPEEIPTAEEVPPPRTEEVTGAEEVPTGTLPQALPGDVQGEQPSRRTEEGLPAGQDKTGRADRDRENEGLLNEINDAVLSEKDAVEDEEERRREGTGRGDRR